jgi:hypothetical protein
VKSPYHGYARTCVYTALGLAAAGALLVTMGGESAWVAGVICLVLSPGVLIVAALLEVQARKQDRHLADFRSGSYLAHWRYTPEEWARFRDAEEARTRNPLARFGERLALGRRQGETNGASAPEVFIGRESAYCDGRFITWTGYGTQLDAMAMEPGDPGILQVTYSLPARGGRRIPYEHRIPVPRGHEPEAMRILAGFGF